MNKIKEGDLVLGKSMERMNQDMETYSDVVSWRGDASIERQRYVAGKVFRVKSSDVGQLCLVNMDGTRPRYERLNEKRFIQL